MTRRLWELCQTREDYRRKWDTQINSRLQCIHLGKPTGQVVLCPDCQGTVQVKLFHCTVHQRCTIGRPVDDSACCVDCPDHQEKMEV
jgi:hypothetical protein